MNTNYSEQIFQSIDTIISQRLNEVSFDKTEICEIISQDKNNKQKYYVSNGSLKYEAYSTDDNKKYFDNQKVYVTIPQGNYDLRKLIIGGYSADETNENLYVNPFNHLITSTTLTLPNSIWAQVNSKEYDDWKDIPIDETKPNFVEFPVEFKYKNIQDFDYIGLDFSFNTNIVGYQGSYALRLSLWNGENELTNKDDNTLILSSKNLYGNPYNLNSSLSFQHLFPWPTRKKDNKIELIPITEITKIKLQLIQDNAFLKQQGENAVNINNWIELVKADLKFGYDVKNITKDELQLALEEGQSLNYTTGETAAARNLYLDWKHFDTFNKPYIFNINQLPNIFEDYKVYWLHYVDGLGENINLPDEYAWNWETIMVTQGLTQNITLTTLYRTDQYKVVIGYKYKNNETIYYAESTGLIFDNKNVAAEPGASNSSQETLRLYLDEGDTGVYNVYGLDGNIVDTSHTRSRNIYFDFLDEMPNGRIKKIDWVFPQSDISMIVEENGRDDNKRKATFKIKSKYLPGAMNNRIWCKVTLKTGEIRQGSLTLQFGEVSTSGSNYSFNIDFTEHRTCLYATGEKDAIVIKATFTKQNGEIMTLPDTIKWSWVNDYESPITIENQEGEETTLSYSGTNIPEDNFSILQATIENYSIDNGIETDLTAYLPIPIAKKGYNYITGATRIVYALDNKTYSKSNEEYRLYPIQKKEPYWKINNETLNGIPKLRGETMKLEDIQYYSSGCTIRPTNYEAQEIPKVNIAAYNFDDGTVLWSQPILILSNRWQSEAINDWNGSVNIDNNNGNIKAPFFIAGKKEENNTLTGLVIGDLNEAGVASGTGIYGFDKGKPRYYLTDKGKFYVGYSDEKTSSFISFNESVDGRSGSNELLIKTNKFILDTSRLKINSNSGITFLNSSDETTIQLNTNGTATIGGWNIGANEIGTGNVHDGGTGIIISTIHGILARKSTGEGYTEYIDTFHLDTKGNAYFAGDITGAKGTFTGDISTAGSISVSGTLTVTGTGTIAGWTIGSNVLKSNDSDSGYRIAMYGNQTASNAWVFQAGTSSQTNFYIRNDGYLYAQGGGTIAGWTIDSNSISKGSTILSSSQTDGKITSSNIEINGGTIKLPAYWTTVTINNTSIKMQHNYTGAFAQLCTSQDIEGELVLEYYNKNKKAWSGIQTSDTDTTPSGLSLVHEVIKHHPDGYDYWTKTTDTGVWINDLCSSSNSEYEWLAFGSTPNVSPARIRSNGVDMHLFCATNGAIYCGGTGADKKISTSSSGPSSLNVKTNLYNLQDNYSLLYQDLQQLNLYSYDYKYKNVVGDLTSDYGFIIDEIEALPILSQYFRHFSTTKLINKYNQIQEIDCDNPEYNLNCQTIHIKEWERDSYIKGLFVIVKTLQYKIDTLENEIKELKQNEI